MFCSLCREEGETATPTGSATAAALGYAEPPPAKKEKERSRTKTECKRMVAAELLESGMTPSKVSAHLDCTPKFLRTVKRLMEEKREKELHLGKGKWAESRSLSVKGRPGRPRKRTPGMQGLIGCKVNLRLEPNSEFRPTVGGGILATRAK